MNITVNEKSIAYVLNNQINKKELSDYLNSIIDKEIEKENPDTRLLDECTELLFALETGNMPDLPGADIMLGICIKSLSKGGGRAKKIAAAIIVFLFASGALLQTNPAIAQQTREWLNQIAYALGIAANTTDTGRSEIVSIYAEPKEDASFRVKSEEDINPEDVSIYAVDKYNFEKHIPVSECTLNKERIDSAHIMLTYSYEGCACSIIYELEAE